MAQQDLFEPYRDTPAPAKADGQVLGRGARGVLRTVVYGYHWMGGEAYTLAGQVDAAGLGELKTLGLVVERPHTWEHPNGATTHCTYLSPTAAGLDRALDLWPGIAAARGALPEARKTPPAQSKRARRERAAADKAPPPLELAPAPKTPPATRRVSATSNQRRRTGSTRREESHGRGAGPLPGKRAERYRGAGDIDLHKLDMPAPSSPLSEADTQELKLLCRLSEIQPRGWVPTSRFFSPDGLRRLRAAGCAELLVMHRPHWPALGVEHARPAQPS